MPDLRHTDIQYLHGVGPKRAELLKKELNVKTYYDLLYYFPFRYIDRSFINTVKDLRGDEASVQLRGRFLTFTTAGEGRKRRLQALFTDGTGTIEVVWFNRVASIQKTYNTSTQYILYGKPSFFNNHLNIVHPEVDLANSENIAQGLQGVYNLTETLRNRSFTSRNIHKLVVNVLNTPGVQNIPETLPPELIQRYRMMPLGEALRNIHQPVDQQSLQRAQFRLKFEELFFLELNILHYIKGSSRRLVGHKFPHVGYYFNNFYHHFLQFPLTEAQKRVIREMRHDMGSGKQMNRLLQGDVGSGKTIVAFMTALIALDNGYQACIMAPTEILAGQHLETIQPLAEGLGVKVALLTGSTRKRERTAIHDSLMSGELQILIGTHALIEDTVQFHNLGLAIIDEQHRFGVAQRARLWSKNRVAPPHVLVMTATPIPRTLAMTVYGDLDVSVIDELPPGRKPVTTVLRHEPDRFKMYQFVGSQLRQGRQAYIVYPLIEENEKLDLHALEQGYEQVRDVFPHYNVAMVHGRMKPAVKDHQMMLFATGKAHILVATTVIEVGVNVPNASVMVIEDAERFGLSQLHQLRGRVGRGADQSYCILMARSDLGRDTRHRLQVMTQTNDGFVVAEEDMKLRGPGDMEGTMQSGIAFNLHIANLAQDGQIIQMARNAAEDYLCVDPGMETTWGRKMASHIKEIFDKQTNWGLIS
ncbi:MAG: ATP-dependent DNA helicase RecG [Muribaculaceae bacterium]|nr:ATP-dependent DNA helicase RecG [Muribaculaceae bacterium]